MDGWLDNRRKLMSLWALGTFLTFYKRLIDLVMKTTVKLIDNENNSWLQPLSLYSQVSPKAQTNATLLGMFS